MLHAYADTHRCSDTLTNRLHSLILWLLREISTAFRLPKRSAHLPRAVCLSQQEQTTRQVCRPFCLGGNMKEIPLTQGKVALVDDEDYEELSKHKWYAAWRASSRTYYAARPVCGKVRGKMVYMHRELLGLTDRRQRGDHIDHNGLNNQRSNIRACSQSQNLANMRLRKNASGYKGVTFHPFSGLWHAHLQFMGKPISLKYHRTAEAAARAYDRAARKHFGEFACCNFEE